jgi:prephenate dehydrogenase
LERLALSDTGLWTDIFLTNRKPLLRVLRRYIRLLEKIGVSLSRGVA